MALDPARIAQAAAAFLDELEDEYAGENVELLRFAIVAELDSDVEGFNAVHVRTENDQERTLVAGLLARGLDVIVNPTP